MQPYAMDRPETGSPRLYALFHAITGHPRIVIALGTLVILGMLLGLKDLVKDTSVDALIPPDHGSFKTNQRSKEIFGIADPIIIALLADDVFAPERLQLVATLHHAIEQLPNVRSNSMYSLASESSIEGLPDRIEVRNYLEPLPATEEDVAALRARWREMAPHRGTLVSEDGAGAIIAVELINTREARDTYAKIADLVRTHDHHGMDVHISGMAAVSGYLSTAIDRDSRVMQPIIFVVVLAIVYVAFRSALATSLPVLVIIASAGGALGLMAWAGVPYFTITSALPVILVAVSVADAIHILTSYYVIKDSGPDLPERQLVIATMVDIAPPITLTTLTTMAGFLGIGLADIMPPIKYFAYFAMVGVALAWSFSVTVFPNLILLTRPRPSRALAGFYRTGPDRLTRAFTAVGAFTARRVWLCCALCLALAAIALTGASRLQIDRALVEGFKPHAPIRIADGVINEHFAGTAFLDVMVRADEPGGLLQADSMRRIRSLQEYMETLPYVEKTVAITDYIGLLHKAVNNLPDDAARRPLPASDDAVAQYLLVYEASGDPTDFEEEIDTDYQTALVRGYMNSRRYSQEIPTVRALQQYVDREFAGDDLNAALSGRVNVRYHWLQRLAGTHFLGVALSLGFVFLVATLLFRRLSTGLIAVLPVTLTVLILYGAMGALGIYLEPATTMFAAISIGVGVDFAVHLVDRFENALRAEDDVHAAVIRAMPETSRACFFNALALGLGFSVLLFSDLLTLMRFGGLVAVAACASFVSALLTVPTLMALREKLRRQRLLRAELSQAVLVFVAPLTCLGLVAYPDSIHAAEPDGEAIARQVDARTEGDNSVRELEMKMTDRRGKVRKRNATVLHEDSDGVRRTLIVYTQPKSVRDTAFLSYDYDGADTEDEQWLYLPAMRKTRRIPSSDRGDYFLGTDFTYDDIQSGLKFDLDDYDFTYEGMKADGVRHVIRGVPKTDRIARDLGYGSFRAEVDGSSWMPLRIDFMDTKGQPLKRVDVLQNEQIGGVWTPLQISVINHQTSHSTYFHYRDVRYNIDLPERAFLPSELTRGLRGL